LRLQGALGALNDRAVAPICWPTSPRRPVPRGRRQALKVLAKQAESGEKRAAAAERAWEGVQEGRAVFGDGLAVTPSGAKRSRGLSSEDKVPPLRDGVYPSEVEGRSGRDDD